MKPEVVIIGLGYIGLPTSALIASNGTNVLGVDINQYVVDTINQGKIHIVEPDLDEIVSVAVSKALDLLNNEDNFVKMSRLHNPYGDGLASKRIVEFIKNI